MGIYQDFEDFVELLKENGVEYLVIGGYATSIHSRPRYTKDLDIWINCTKKNAQRVLKVLDSFGTGNLKVSLDDLLNKDMIIQMGFPPVRIDLLKDIPGLKFNDAYKRKIEVNWGNIENVNFISLDDLIENKKQTGRNEDKEDLEWIRKYTKKKRKT